MCHLLPPSSLTSLQSKFQAEYPLSRRYIHFKLNMPGIGLQREQGEFVVSTLEISMCAGVNFGSLFFLPKLIAILTKLEQLGPESSSAVKLGERTGEVNRGEKGNQQQASLHQRWKNNRNTGELRKSEVWYFIELTVGPGYKTVYCVWKAGMMLWDEGG